LKCRFLGQESAYTRSQQWAAELVKPLGGSGRQLLRLLSLSRLSIAFCRPQFPCHEQAVWHVFVFPHLCCDVLTIDCTQAPWLARTRHWHVPRVLPVTLAPGAIPGGAAGAAQPPCVCAEFCHRASALSFAATLAPGDAAGARHGHKVRHERAPGQGVHQLRGRRLPELRDARGRRGGGQGAAVGRLRARAQGAGGPREGAPRAGAGEKPGPLACDCALQRRLLVSHGPNLVASVGQVATRARQRFRPSGLSGAGGRLVDGDSGGALLQDCGCGVRVVGGAVGGDRAWGSQPGPGRDCDGCECE
jgi:hypothetical protein